MQSLRTHVRGLAVATAGTVRTAVLRLADNVVIVRQVVARGFTALQAGHRRDREGRYVGGIFTEILLCPPEAWVRAHVDLSWTRLSL